MMKIYILTSTIMEHDEHGQYFVTAFKLKPTEQDLITFEDITVEMAEALVRTGHSETWGSMDYSLREILI
tara:strand:+ start:430 stop:639 length:210 start_codon:yes stop_codon:yes gene_type:complete